MREQKLKLYQTSTRTERNDTVTFDVELTMMNGLGRYITVKVEDNEPLDVEGPIISRAVDEALAGMGLYNDDTGWHYDPETTTYDDEPADNGDGKQVVVKLQVQ